MEEHDITVDTIAAARKRAEASLKRRAEVIDRRDNVVAAHNSRLEAEMRVSGIDTVSLGASLQSVGFLVAAGDSWFNYPLHNDVLNWLEDDHGYTIESSAHHGDAIEAMAYRDGQLDKIGRCIEKVKAQGASPKAILLSGGGNDIAGKEFGMLLNNATSKIGGWNAEVVDGVLNERIMIAFKAMLVGIDAMCRGKLGESRPVLVHGYDYIVPDGRGFLGILAGPWLQPGFREKLFEDLATNVALMRSVIDSFNQMLSQLATEADFQYVRFVDLRNTLSTELRDDAYRRWWDNELHPTGLGFRAVAEKFAAELNRI